MQPPIRSSVVARSFSPASRFRAGSWPALARVVFLLGVLSVGMGLQGCLILDLRPVGQVGEVTADDLPSPSHIEGDRVYGFLGPDRIPALDAPTFVDAQDADFMLDDELVLGVLHEAGAKAYSLWHLDRHEVVNDWLGKEPVAVTW